MSQLKLTADGGGGTVSLKGPSSTTGNAAIELTVPGTGSATVDTLKRSGNILQVVNTLKTSSFTTTSTDVSSSPRGVEVTGLTASITPSSASNKILVRVTFGLTNSNQNYYAHSFLYRGTTLLGTSTSMGHGGGLGLQSHSIERLDSPNTTSSITYSMRLAAEGNTAKIGQGSSGSDDEKADDATITLMEVAA